MLRRAMLGRLRPSHTNARLNGAIETFDREIQHVWEGRQLAAQKPRLNVDLRLAQDIRDAANDLPTRTSRRSAKIADVLNLEDVA